MSEPPQPPPDPPRSLLWRGLAIVLFALLVAGFSLARGIDYVRANFPWMLEPLRWVGIER